MESITAGTQLVLGAHEEKHFSYRHVETKIREFSAATGVRRLMVWNTLGGQWFDRLGSLCRKLGLEYYLWFPVLADNWERPARRAELVEDGCGRRGYGSAGLWPGFTDIDEEFLFCCPNNPEAVADLLTSYGALLDRHAFDGVFLDRIRYPSPANGIEGLLSCFCPACRQAYEARYGGSLIGLRDDILKTLRESEEPEAPLLLGGNPAWQAVKAFREESITNLVRRFLAPARDRGLTCALDLLSPALAPLVGQSYESLLPLADWVKAMTYLSAAGPAGLPLEFSSLYRGLRELGGDKAPAPALVSRLEEVSGLRLGSGPWLTKGLDTGNLRIEMEKVLAAAGDTRVYAGLEFVNHPQFASALTPERCRAYVKAVQRHNYQLIACWNLLYIPQEYYRFLSGKSEA